MSKHEAMVWVCCFDAPKGFFARRVPCSALLPKLIGMIDPAFQHKFNREHFGEIEVFLSKEFVLSDQWPFIAIQ
jgi:hypothetical protein